MDKEITKNILKRLDHIESRLAKLEGNDFNSIQDKKATTAKQTKGEKFKGAKGGILFLISKGYFSQRRSTLDTRGELKKNGYDYKREVVQTALNRLSKINGPLVALKESGKKVYVKRK